MSEKTIALIGADETGDGGRLRARLHAALIAAGCRVETAAAADSERILDLVEAGAIPMVWRTTDE